MTRLRPQRRSIEVPPAGVLSDLEKQQVDKAIQQRMRPQSSPPQEAQPQTEPLPAVVKGEVKARPATPEPIADTASVIIEPEMQEDIKQKMFAAVTEYYSLSKQKRRARMDQYQFAFTWLMEHAPQEFLKFQSANPEESADNAAQTERHPREPEKFKKWLAAKVIGRAAFGVLAWVQGLALPYTLEQYRKQLAKRRAVNEDIEATLKEIEASVTPEMKTAAREGAWFIPVSEQKVTELRAKIDALVADGQITPKRRDQVLGELGEKTINYSKEENSTREQYLQSSAQALGDYLEKQVTKTQLLRSGIDTSFFITGNFFARGLTYFGLAPIERALKQKREYELDLRARVLREGQEYAPAFAEKVKDVVWERTVKQGLAEFLRSARGKGATAEREASRWCRFIDRVRAYATLARAFGISSAATADWGRLDVSEGAEEFLKAWEAKGPAALYDSFLRGTARVYHLSLEGERGQETLEARAQAKPAAVIQETVKETADETPKLPLENTSEEIEKDILDKNGVIKQLITKEQATISGSKLVIQIGDEKSGFAEIQQALRRVIGQEIKLTGDHLRDVDADRIEKMVKLLTHVLRGEKLPAFMFEKSADIPVPHAWADIVDWTEEGDLVIKDYTRFESELMPKLEQLADQYKWSGLAYLNNTGHKVWQQEIADARAVVEGKPIVADDFDKSARVHQAEIEVATHETAGHEIPGLTVNPDEVTDEATYPMHLGKDVIPVEDGAIDHVIVTRGDKSFDYLLAEPIDVDHPYAGVHIKEALDKAYTETKAVRQGVGDVVASEGTADATPGPVAGKADFSDLIKTPVDKGGLVGPDGYIRFGEVRFRPEWLDKIDESGVSEFSNDPIGVANIPWHLRLFNEALTLRALAETMKNHPDTGTVGGYIVKHQDELAGWMRETPPAPGPGGGII